MSPSSEPVGGVSPSSEPVGGASPSSEPVGGGSPSSEPVGGGSPSSEPVGSADLDVTRGGVGGSQGSLCGVETLIAKLLSIL